MKFRVGDGSTGVHWRQDGDKFFLDMRLTPRKHEIGADASAETSDPDVSIEFTNPKIGRRHDLGAVRTLATHAGSR